MEDPLHARKALPLEPVDDGRPALPAEGVRRYVDRVSVGPLGGWPTRGADGTARTGRARLCAVQLRKLIDETS